MKWTNDSDLPYPLAHAVEADPYTRGDPDTFASVSELSGPTRIAVLKRQHEAHRTKDVGHAIKMLRGRCIHEILSKYAEPEALVEERMYMTVVGPTTGRLYKISGAPDHYLNGVLSDWKLTSRYTVERGRREGVSDEWSWQLHGYRLLLSRNDKGVVTAMQNVCLMDDWKRPESVRKEDYPKYEAEVIGVPIEHGLVEIAAYFGAKAEALEAALEGTVPVCTHRERWQDPSEWAVMKPGGKRALAKYKTRDEAERAVQSVEGGTLEERPAEARRCANDYCDVAAYCDWWQLTGGTT